METTHASPQNLPDTQNSRWLQSLFPPTANKTFAKLQRTQSLARPTIRAAFSNFLITPFRLFTHNLPTRLAAQTQTTFSMLQIKTIPKNTFWLRTYWTFSFIYLTSISERPYKLIEETTKHTHTLQLLLAKTNNISPTYSTASGDWAEGYAKYIVLKSSKYSYQTLIILFNNHPLVQLCFTYSDTRKIIFKHIYLNYRWNSNRQHHSGSKWTWE